VRLGWSCVHLGDFKMSHSCFLESGKFDNPVSNDGKVCHLEIFTCPYLCQRLLFSSKGVREWCAERFSAGRSDTSVWAKGRRGGGV